MPKGSLAASLELTIHVDEPGTLLDLIKAQTDNLADVTTLNVSGSINDADLADIRTSLRFLNYLDLKETDLTVFPEKCFYEKTALREIVFPEPLATIKDYALYGCIHLQKATFSNNLNSIGKSAFEYCPKLPEVNFPASLTSIAYRAFYDCDELTEVTLNEGLTSLSGSAFGSCDNLKVVTLPSTLAALSESFANNPNLHTVNLAEGLVRINDKALSYCPKLCNFEFPSTLYYIGESAFLGDEAIEKVVFNEGLYEIDRYAFANCTGLKEVTFPSTINNFKKDCFLGCTNLEIITCHSLEPPYVHYYVGDVYKLPGTTLYAPAVSIDTYENREPWSMYPNIEPIDYWPAAATILDYVHIDADMVSQDYKPDICLDHNELTQPWKFGRLQIDGSAPFHIGSFKASWMPGYSHLNSCDWLQGTTAYGMVQAEGPVDAESFSLDFYSSDGIWWPLCFPFDVKVSDIVGLSNGQNHFAIRGYNGQKRAESKFDETWVRMTSDSVLHAGQGYILHTYLDDEDGWMGDTKLRFTPVDNEKKNNFFAFAPVIVALTEYPSEFPHNQSWSFIGNPYPCYYDIRYLGWSAPLTVWDAVGRTYVSVSPLDDKYLLEPCQAFFVQASADMSEVVFDPAGRVLENPLNYIYGEDYFGATERAVFNLELSDGEQRDRTRVVINPEADMKYELQRDAVKSKSLDGNVPQLWTLQSGVEYAINERPTGDGSVRLAFSVAADGRYEISLSSDVSGWTVEIEDLEKDESQALTSENGYSFATKAGKHIGRFLLHFKADGSGIATAERGEEEGNGDIYTLGGIKVEKPSATGIYIKDNKKVIIR